MPRKDLLASAHGSEIDWTHAAPVLQGFYPGNGEFVYFVGEPEGGPIKIGRALHPVKRLRELQTGNPRRLRIERLVYGGSDVEGLLHRYWHKYAIAGNPRRAELNPQYRLETEWFRADGREEILAAADAILERQQTADVEETFAESVGVVMSELGHELVVGDTVTRLAKSVGYAKTRLRAV